MLSTAADVLSVAQAAPWLAVGLLALLAAAWVYRQSRRQLGLLRAEVARSARAQGERLGKLEQAVQLADLRRRQVEDVLLDLGAPLSYWPPDGPDQRRPAPRDVEDQDDALTTEAAYLTGRPPLPSRSRH